MMSAAFAVGTLAQYLTVVAVIGVAFLVYRGGGSAALGILETANGILEKRVHDLEQQSRADQKKIGELEARTDVSLALVPVLAEIQSHDLRVQQRADKMLTVLDLIAQRLGPDANGAHE
jgi:hypothetical protein